MKTKGFYLLTFSRKCLCCGSVIALLSCALLSSCVYSCSTHSITSEDCDSIFDDELDGEFDDDDSSFFDEPTDDDDITIMSSKTSVVIDGEEYPELNSEEEVKAYLKKKGIEDYGIKVGTQRFGKDGNVHEEITIKIKTII